MHHGKGIGADRAPAMTSHPRLMLPFEDGAFDLPLDGTIAIFRAHGSYPDLPKDRIHPKGLGDRRPHNAQQASIVQPADRIEFIWAERP